MHAHKDNRTPKKAQMTKTTNNHWVNSKAFVLRLSIRKYFSLVIPVFRKALLDLRYYVRESIKKIYLMKKSKPDIMDLLNSQGFGGVMP